MHNSMSDRRNAPRYPLILVAEVFEAMSGAKITARTSDVSRTGCYLDTLNPLPRGTQITVKLQNGSESFETDAMVKYVSPGLGMGVAFAEGLAPYKLMMLERWLANCAKVGV